MPSLQRKSRHPRFLARTFILVATAFILSSCEWRTAQTERKETAQQHAIHGVVQSLDPASRTATIKHDAIKGFMGAMTMEYPVKDPADLAKLRVGETINGTVYVKDTEFWIGNLKEAK
jgi:Cu/Ag efflux protein CusF